MLIHQKSVLVVLTKVNKFWNEYGRGYCCSASDISSEWTESDYNRWHLFSDSTNLDKYHDCPPSVEQWGQQKFFLTRSQKSFEVKTEQTIENSIWWYQISRSAKTDERGITFQLLGLNNISFQIFTEEENDGLKFQDVDLLLDKKIAFNEFDASHKLWVILRPLSDGTQASFKIFLSQKIFTFWDYILIGSLLFGIFGFLITMIIIWVWIATRENFKRRMEENQGIRLDNIDQMHNDRNASQIGLANNQGRRGRNNRTERDRRRNDRYILPLQRRETDKTACNSQE